MFALLSERNFRLLWCGQLASQFGDRLTQLLLVALVSSRAAGSPLSLAKVLVVTSLPALLVNPFAGAFVDRWNRRRTMITCDLLRALAILALPWAALIPNPFVLYTGVFLLFSLSAFFVPARLAMIPDLVEPQRLSQANALFTTSGMIGSTFILLIGALVMEAIGTSKASFLNAASYLFSALFILPIARKEAKSKETSPGGSVILKEIGILREICEGVVQLWRNQKTRQVAGLLTLLMAGAGASVVAGTILIQQSLHSVTRDLGFLSLWIGMGMLVGALAHGRWGSRLPRRRILGLAFLGCGMALWIFVFAVQGLSSGTAASAAAGLLGFWVAPVGIVANTLVHEGHPERFHGRIFSSLGIVVNLSLIGSMLLAGWLTEQGGRGLLLVATGCGFAFLGALLLYYRWRFPFSNRRRAFSWVSLPSQ